MPRMVELQATYERGEDPTSWPLNLSENNAVFAVVVGLGNGIFDELRAVGNSKDALVDFINLIRAGGYDQYSQTSHPSKKLYQAGDLCFTDPDPVVFVSLQTSNDDRLSITEVDALLAPKATESSMANQTPRKVVKDLNDLRVSSELQEDRSFWKFW